MSLIGDITRDDSDNDAVWRALADPTRRAILDLLAGGERTTGDVVEAFEHLSRTNVMKHLGVLERADLVLVRREGRVRWNYLNAVPIQRIYDRWVSRHIKGVASAMSRLKDHIEGSES